MEPIKPSGGGVLQLLAGDCLELMDTIPDGSVDMVLCDLPYGTTANRWDTPLPFASLWESWGRVCKKNAAIVLFSDEPFTSNLIFSNKRGFRYKWIWDKTRGSNFANAHIMPMKAHEEIVVFYRARPTYNPQFWYSTPYKEKGRVRSREIEGLRGGSAAMYAPDTESKDGRRYPLSILRFPRDGTRVHPTQKPVALLEYLIKTYTNPGEIVLDNCMGSGSTGVAAVNTDRGFIGIELDPDYYNTAERRIMEAREAHDRQRAAAPGQG